MATIRERILDAMVAAFNTSAPLGVPVAVRRRLPMIETSMLPFVDIMPVQEQTQSATSRLSSPVVRRTMRVKVRCWAAGDSAEAACDTMVAWATKALAGNTLGGLAHDIEELGTEWQSAIVDAQYGVAEVEFAVSYQTKTADQELHS